MKHPDPSTVRLAGHQPGRTAGLTPLLAFALFFLGCGNAASDAPAGAQSTIEDSLRAALTLYASFDEGIDADFAAGNPAIHWAPSWSRRDEGAPGTLADSLVAPVPGVQGEGIEFVRGSPSILYYEGRDNIAYTQSDWSGTISFWLSLDPDEDLDPGYTDPLQISPNLWNDAALFVDFTDANPRRFRFAAFADYDVWNPDSLDWEAIAVDDRPMVDIADTPFDGDSWTHVVMTFERFNTGEADGILTSYFDGELQGTLEGREQTLTWDPDETIIALGLNFVGRFDELSIYDRALDPDEVAALHALEGGVASLL